MLLRFKVQNFLSFNEFIDTNTGIHDGIEFSMIPGKVRLNPEHLIKNKRQNCLRFGALYGANASGKSNLIKAISFFQEMTKTGKLPIGYSNSYCRTCIENKDKPSYFEAEIIINDVLYAYGFQIILSSNTITSEWLFRLDNSVTEQTIFYKDGQDDTYHFGELLKDNELVLSYSKIRSNDILLLSDLNNGKDGLYEHYPEVTILKDVYNWICNDLEIIGPNEYINTSTRIINIVSFEQMAKLLYSFGTNIVNIVEVPISVDNLFTKLSQEVLKEVLNKIEHFKRNNAKQETTNPAFLKFSILTSKDLYDFEYSPQSGTKVYSVQFIHKNTISDISFRLFEESTGTIRLFKLIEILLSDKNKTYILDDLDQYLHPNLTYHFIKKFFEYTLNRHVQLIVATHEQSLLDLELVRRDEIWFSEKNDKGETSIYSLEEYNTRFDQRIDKAYLDGRFGATPSFDL